jgi:hypothetical protein
MVDVEDLLDPAYMRMIPYWLKSLVDTGFESGAETPSGSSL